MAVKHGPCLLTLNIKKKKSRIQAPETQCLKKPLRISYLQHKTNDWVRSKISFRVGPQEPLLAAVKGRKLAWLGYIKEGTSLTMLHNGLLQRKVGEELS